MAILNFPANPSVDDTYEENGIIYTWDGVKWTANSTSAFLPITGGELTGDLTVPSLNGGPLAGFRNQIINGDFNIWQRGTTIALSVGSEYHADRWKCNTTIAAQVDRRNSPVPGATYAVLLDAATGRLAQGVELSRQGSSGQFINGSTWTLSFWCTADDLTGQTLLIRFVDAVGSNANEATVVSRNFTAEERVDQTSSTTVFYKYECTFTVSVSANATNTAFEVSLPGGNALGGEVRYSGIQLEPGPVATPFERRPIGTELALCQRYYQSHVVGNNDLTIEGNAPSAGAYACCQFMLPVEMRAIPKLDTTRGTLISNSDPFGVTVHSTSIVKGSIRAIAAGRFYGSLNSFRLDAEL